MTEMLRVDQERHFAADDGRPPFDAQRADWYSSSWTVFDKAEDRHSQFAVHNIMEAEWSDTMPLASGGFTRALMLVSDNPFSDKKVTHRITFFFSTKEAADGLA